MKSALPPPTWPKQVTITTTTACNLRCTMCWLHGSLIATESMRTMPLDRFEAILAEIGPHIKVLGLTVLGEPLCDPQLAQRLEILSRFPHVAIHLQTNGLLLDEIHLAPFRNLPNPVRICVSLDSVDPVIYASLRQPAQLNQILPLLRDFQGLAERLNFRVESFELNATLMLRNLPGTPDLLRFASEIGADRVWLVHMTVIHQDLHSESLYLYPAFSNRVLAECKQLAGELGLLLECAQPFALEEDAVPAPAQGPERLACPSIRHMASISLEGVVSPCCGGNMTPLGRIDVATRFGDLWGGPEHLRLLEGLEVGCPAGRCSGCRFLEGWTEHLTDGALVGSPRGYRPVCLKAEPGPEDLGPQKWLEAIPEAILRRATAIAWEQSLGVKFRATLEKTFLPIPEAFQNACADWKANGTKLFLAPAGVMVRRLLRASPLGECLSLAILDANPARHSHTFMGIPVRSHEFLERERPDIVLIASPNFQEEILASFLARGLARDAIRIFPSDFV